MSISGAEYLVKALQAAGVDVVFGYPGGSVLGICDAFARSSLRFVLTRHEQGAVFAADGYARATGKVGVCLATSGPGATNLITGLANAYLDSVPLVAITGQVAADQLGSDAFQEADLFGASLSITKHNYVLRTPGDLPEALCEAFHIAATGRRGPVLVDIPRDIAAAQVDATIHAAPSLPGYQPTQSGHPLMLRRAAELLVDAKRPVIWSGGGVIASGTSHAVQQLAAVVGAPVVMSLLGLGAVPSDHPLNLGMIGMHGHPWANQAVRECDVLVVLGARFGDRATGALAEFAPAARVIHVDIDPAEIGKRRKATVPIVADLGTALPALVELTRSVARAASPGTDGFPEPTQSWRQHLEQVRRSHAWPLLYEGLGGLHPGAVVQAVASSTPPDALFVTDVGQHQMWAAQLLRVDRPRSFFTSGGLGAMGYSIPAAIGAQIGCPDRPVVVIVGDGGFQMTSNELATIAAQALPIKILLINNGCLGMVRQWQEMFYGRRYFGVDATGPDFCALAHAYGLEAQRIAHGDDLQSGVDAMTRHAGPFLLECVVDPEANVFPIVPAGCGAESAILAPPQTRN